MAEAVDMVSGIQAASPERTAGLVGEDLYKADAAVGSNDTAGVPEMVAYQVSKRFVDNEDSASDEATSIVYYALGIGHHTGIIDCFEERLRCPLYVMEQVQEMVPPGSLLESKLRTAYGRGEAYIDKYDLQPLSSDIDAALGSEDAYRNIPLEGLPAPRELEVGDATLWLEEFRILLDRMMADWDASVILRRRG